MNLNPLPHSPRCPRRRRFLSPVAVIAAIIAALFVPAATTRAQTIPMKVVPQEEYPFLERFTAPLAWEMAVCDHAGLLAVLHDREHNAHVSLFRLDAAGKPGEKPFATIVLPKPDPLKDRKSYPLSAQFHPKLPLLYVWQDIEAPGKNEATDEQREEAYDIFEHLHIYKIEGDAATLAQSSAKGDEYAYSRRIGYIALNSAATRVYVPNMLTPRKRGAPTRGVGFIELGPDGLVVPDPADTTGKQPKMTTLFSGVFGLDHIAGGFVPVSDEVVIVSGGMGPASWDLVDARQQLGQVYMWPPRYNERIAGHPTLPMIYLGSVGDGYVHCHEHAEGYLTMLPKTATVSGPNSRPIVLAKHKFVAFGGPTVLQFLSINDEGRYTGEVRHARIRRDNVRAMEYSTRFDKLYVAEEPKP